jgi:hypothetical protein
VAADAGAAAEQKLAAAHQVLRQTKGLQFDFTTAHPEKPPAWAEALLRFLSEFAPVLKYVFWGGLALALVMIAWFIVSELMSGRIDGRMGRKSFTQGGVRPEPARALALLEEADRLAAEGRFDEAIHVLLFRSIDDISGRRPGAVKPALTSRDIVRLAAMPDEARHAFARIAEAVERTFFGGRPAAKDDFARCRSDYETFAFSEGWR